MQYEDFSLKIEPQRGDVYPVIVLRSPAGEARSSFRLPFDPDEIGDILFDLGQTVRRSGGALLRDASPGATRTPPQRIGDQLFDSLFAGTVRSLLERSLGMIHGRQFGLRIKLHIDPEDASLAKLASLPWELMYRRDTRDFLNLSRFTPIVRYLDVQRPYAPLPLELPLRILVVISSPLDYARLDLDKEHRQIEASWAREEGVKVEFVQPATLDELQDRLTERPYHVLHYMGHGGFDERTGSGMLIMEDEEELGAAVDGNTLGVLLRDVPSLRLVFLNACETARVTKQVGLDPFAGVAAALVMAGIPAVVAMQFPISDAAAIRFARRFYPLLARGHPVDYAVAEGRRAIRLAESGTMEWATPVLFMRAPEGVIFDLTKVQRTEAPLFEQPRRPEEWEQRLEELYTSGLSAFWLEDWDRAARHFQAIADVRPDYEDVTDKLAEAKRRAALHTQYAKAQAARDAGDWHGAVAALEAVVAQQPDFRDAAAMLEQARGQTQLAELYAEAQRLHRNQKWEAVLNVFKQIQALDPQYSDPDELLVSARQELDAVERQERLATLYKQGLRHINAEAWHEALASFEEIQRLEVGYRDTDALLARVQRELAKPVHPSLALTLSVKPQQVSVGDTATWTVTVHNDGDDELSQVTVKRGRESIAEPFSLAVGAKRRLTFTTSPSKSGQKTETVAATAVASNGQTVKARAKTALQAQAVEKTAPPAKGVGVQLPEGFEATAAPAEASRRLRNASATVAQGIEAAIDAVDWSTLGWIALVVFLLLAAGGALFLPNDLTSVAFSPDGAMVASGSWDDEVKVWQVSDGALVRTQEGHKNTVLSVAFSPDGTLMASGSADDTVGLWDASYPALRTLKGHTSDVYSVAFSPDGKLLASGSGDNTVRLWSVPDGSPLRSLKGHTGDVKSVAFSPDGSLVASGSNDKTIRVWQVSDGRLLQTLESHTSNVEAVAFSPDGNTLASGGWSGPARLWDLADESMRLLGAPTGVWVNVLDVAFSPDGKILATGSSKNRVLLWQVSDGSLLHTLEGHKGDVKGVAFSPDGSTLASASSDGKVRLWDVSTGTSLQTLKAK